MSLAMKFSNTYSQLPESLYRKVLPTPVSNPHVVVFNHRLADQLALPEELRGAAGGQFWSGNQVIPGSEPIAQAYMGHQFGHLNMLGDGRALLLGEVVLFNGERFDIQLKGSGPTPFSRGGDGRAALGPMLREYLISEAMRALGLPTTRSLAVVATGEEVFREKALPGAVLVRVAASHIRVGTFEFAARVDNGASLRALANYTIRRHYPELVPVEEEVHKWPVTIYEGFLRTVIRQQARLIAQWMSIGFIHGVMNTDNMSISGETIDYGPCAFMDIYQPTTVFSSIDRRGRYAYQNQPSIAKWNLTRFAEALLPLLGETEGEAIPRAEALLTKFDSDFEQHWARAFLAKVGLAFDVDSQTHERDIKPEDFEFLGALLKAMQELHLDFTVFFRSLSGRVRRGDFEHLDTAMQNWLHDWKGRLSQTGLMFENIAEQMDRVNPVVIPRNHQVEKALADATEGDDLTHLHALLEALENPFVETDQNFRFKTPPETLDPNYRTFCGT